VAELDLAIGISKKKRLLFKILMGILGSMFFLPERSVGKKKKKKKNGQNAVAPRKGPR
jgi:hypothetical protein